MRIGTTYRSHTYHESYYQLKIICPHCNKHYDTARISVTQYKNLHTCTEIYCRHCFRDFILSVKQLPEKCAECEKRVTCLLDGYAEPELELFEPYYADTSSSCTGSMWVGLDANSTSDCITYTTNTSGTTYE